MLWKKLCPCAVSLLRALAQPLSGAPGYLAGFPLLAGVEVTDPAATDPSSTRKAVARLASGLQLPGPGPAGRCSPSPVYAPTIGFGFNLSSSCSIGLTLAQVGSSACGLTENALLGMVGCCCRDDIENHVWTAR